MPYTPEEKAYILQKKGLDPSSYDIDDGGFIQPLAPVVPVQAPVVPETDTPSLFDTARRAATQTIGPTVLGGLASGLTGLGIAASGGLGAIPTALLLGAGGFGGGMAGNKLQEALVPEEVKKDFFLRPEDSAANPKTAAAASLIPSLLFGNPVKGAKELLTAGKGLLATGRGSVSGLRDIDSQVLKNAAIGSGINAGISAIQNGELSPQDALMAAVGGSLFNSPWKGNPLNKAFGIQEVPDDYRAHGIRPKVTGFDGVSTPFASPLMSPLMTRLSTPSGVRNPNEGRHPSVGINTAPPKAEAGLIQGLTKQEYRNQLAEITKRATLKNKANDIWNRDAKNIKGDNTPLSIEEQAYNALVEKAKTAAVETQQQQAARLAQEKQIAEKAVPKKEFFTKLSNLGKNLSATREESIAREAATPAEGVTTLDKVVSEPFPPTAETVRTVEQSKLELSKAKLEKELQTLKADEERISQLAHDKAVERVKEIVRTKGRIEKDPAYLEQRVNQITDKLLADFPDLYNNPSSAENFGIRFSKSPEAPTKRNLTPEEIEFASRRGVGVEEMPELGSNTRGAEQYPTRQVKINPDNSTSGTIGHEVGGHTLIEDLKNSTNPKDRKFAKNLEEAYSNSEEAADRVGEDIARRLELKTKGTWKEKLKDYIADVRNKDDLIRKTGARAVHDAPFGTRKELVNEKTVGQRFLDMQELPIGSFGVTRPANPTIREEDDIRYSNDSLTKPKLSRAEKITYFTNELGGIMEQMAGNVRGESEALSAWSRIRRMAGSLGAAEGPQNLDTPDIGYSEDAMRRDMSSIRRSIISGVEAGTIPKNLLDKLDALLPSVAEQRILPESTDIRYSKISDGIQNVFRSEIDSIGRDKDTATIAPYLENLYRSERSLKGKLVEAPLHEVRKAAGLSLTSPVEYFKGSNPILEKVFKYGYDMRDNGQSNIRLTPQEKETYSKVRAFFDGVADERNTHPELHQGEKHPHYIPDVMSVNTADTLSKNSVSFASNKLKKDYIDFTVRKMVESSAVKPDKALKQATNRLNEILASLQHDKQVNLADHFGPLDDSSGYGLPESWRATNPLEIMQSFGSRAAKRIAYHKEIETTPAHKMLFDTTQENLSANPKVAHVLNSFTGIKERSRSVSERANGVIASAMTGTFSGVRDVVSTPFLGAAHMGLGQLPRSIVSSIGNFKKNWSESMKNGVRSEHFAAISSLDSDSGLTGVLTGLGKLREISNTIQGRSALEGVARTIAYGQGKFLASENVMLYKDGKLKAGSMQEKFLEDFGPKDWRKKKLVESDLEEMAARYTEAVQQTYNPQDLPKFATDSPVAPFLQLARWNIGKANHFMKYVVEPAQRGNYKPLLNAVAVTLLGGGAAIEGLNEMISGRKSKLPSVKELSSIEAMDGETAKMLGYKIAGMAALSGFGGEMSNLVKMAYDRQLGNKSNGYEYLMQHQFNILSEIIPAFVKAASSGDVEKSVDILSTGLENTFQTYRVAMNHLSEKKQGEIEHSDKFRDKRLYEQAFKDNAAVTPDIKPDYNSFYSSAFRKLNPDTVRGNKPIGAMARDAVSEVLNSGDSIQDKKEKLTSLKRGSQQFFPDPETNPAEASKFSSFLMRSQGKNTRYQDFERGKQFQKAKGELIPSL